MVALSIFQSGELIMTTMRLVQLRNQIEKGDLERHM